MAKSILKYTIHSSLAKTLVNEVLSKVSKYYYTFGKTTVWNSSDTPTDVSDTLEYEYTARSNIVLCREVLSNDVTLVIDRINWVNGQIYDQYDSYSESNIAPSGATSLDTAYFYVLTDEFNVYKCISNNNNASSTVKPISKNTGFISDPADGYVWKYMYTIPLFLRNKFLNSSQMPVINALQQNFYSDGRITQVVLNNKGTLYYPNTSLGSVVSKYESGVQNLRYVYGTDIALNSLVAGDRFEVNGEVRTVYAKSTVTIDSVSYYRITIPPTEPLLLINSFSEAKLLKTELVITGDGNKQANPYLLKSITVSDGGTGYSSSGNVTVTFPDPYLTGEKARGSAVVNVNLTGITKTASGSGYTSAPTATFAGGSGSGVAVTSVVGFPLQSITRTQAGSNYSVAPTINIVGDSTIQALAVATISGSVSSIDVGTAGSGYGSTAPTVTVGTEWQATTAYTLDQQIFYSNRLYTVKGAGTSSGTAPTHTSTTVTAGSFVVGYTYTIATLGTTTNWQAIGAPIDAIVGTSFVAIGVGSGNGTATTPSASNGTTVLTYVGVPATATATVTGGSVNTPLTITQAGSGYTSAPSISFSAGGGAAAVATAKILGGINTITLTNVGSGYTGSPTIEIIPDVIDTNVNAGAAVAVLSNNGIVKTMALSSYGSDYVSAPTATFSAPFFTATSANVTFAADTITSSANHNMSTGDGVRYTTSGTVIGNLTASTVYYIIKISDSVFKLALSNSAATNGVAIDLSSAGTGTHTFTATDTGKIAAGTVVASTGFIKSITLTNPGYGYNIIPTPIITDSSYALSGGTPATVVTNVEKTKAYIEPVVDGATGQIISVYIKDGGNGYTYATVAVNRNTINPASGKITSLISVDVNPGSTDTQQALVERSAINGSIDNIQLLDGGTDYTSVIVTINGDGTGTTGLNTKATATATIVSGVITKINIIDRGKDYTNATVTITPTAGTGGSGAQARAIIGPPGGHGKSAIDELFGRTVLMYSRLPVTDVKGISFTSNYRQVTILKNPKTFNSTYYYNGFTGSTCYKVTLGTTPAVNLIGTIVDVYDTPLAENATRTATYTVIAQSGNTIVIQAIDNDDEIIMANPSYRLRNRVSGSGVYYTISYVERPDIDRFSGEILFIDNKAPFAPTSEQPVIITSRFKL